MNVFFSTDLVSFYIYLTYFLFPSTVYLGVRALGVAVVVVVAAMVSPGVGLSPPGGVMGVRGLLGGPPMHQVDLCILTCDSCYKVSKNKKGSITF